MRNLIQIVEDTSGLVTLYRGDSTKIDNFDANKTDLNALLGRGIYLTDNPEVAKDYTAAKGSDDIVFRGEDDARTPQELARLYLQHLVRKAGLDDALRELKSDWEQKFYTEYPTRETRTEDSAEAFQERFRTVRKKVITDYVLRAKKEFTQQRPNLRITRLTTGEYIFTAPERKGHVTEFAVPMDYVARCLHAERPLPDDALAAVKRAFTRASKTHDENQKWDLRVYAPGKAGQTREGGRYNGDETMPNSFDEYVEGYKKHGARYAWTELRFGGDGQNPSLDVIWNGTHSGYHVFGSDPEAQRAFFEDLQRLGYVGLAYDGGLRLAGTGARGGGGLRHNAYVFWDAATINGFKVGESNVTDDEVGDLHKRLRALKIYEP